MAQSFRPCSTTLPECVCPAPPPRLRPESSRTRPTPPRPALGCCRTSPPPDPEWEEGGQKRMRGGKGESSEKTPRPLIQPLPIVERTEISSQAPANLVKPQCHLLPLRIPYRNSLFLVLKKPVCSAAGRQIFGWRAFMQTAEPGPTSLTLRNQRN